MKKEKICGIYKITSPTGKVYIGESGDIKRRWRDYKRSKGRGQPKLQNSFKKYCISNHTFEIIEECLFDELKCRERYWQDFYDVLDKGLNCSLTECGELKKEISEETLQKLSDSLKGRVFSEEHKNKISQSLKGENNGMHGKRGTLNPMFGKKIKKEDNYWFGKKHSEDTKNKMSIAKKGKQSPRKGTKLSESTIELMVQHKRKPVIQFSIEGDFIREWIDMASAERELKINNIGKACKGKQKTAGGFIWKYKKEENE